MNSREMGLFILSCINVWRKAGVVIYMRQVFDKIEYLVGNREILEQMGSARVYPLFSKNVIDFFDALSKKLLTSQIARQYSDVIAYGFWIRRVSLEKESRRYAYGMQKIGRGVVFQIAPSNIPVQFAVLMTYALIAGNMSVIRVSNKAFEQVDIICDAVNSILKEQYPEMAPYLCVIRYEHDDIVTQALSDFCDVRMIWGGDSTIAAIRKAPIKARCIDIGFADRYSLAVIDADEYLVSDKDALARDFYVDTYYSDQNACSSTRLVVWTGNKINSAKEIFWETMEELVLEKYTMNAISSSEKLLNTALYAAYHPGIKEIKKSNLLVRIELPELFGDVMDYKGNSGYFFEYSTDNLETIVPILKERCQTVTYVGNIEKSLRGIIKKYGVRGVDRIVPLGHSMDLSFVWDGYDLPEILSRCISDT